MRYRQRRKTDEQHLIDNDIHSISIPFNVRSRYRGYGKCGNCDCQHDDIGGRAAFLGASVEIQRSDAVGYETHRNTKRNTIKVPVYKRYFRGGLIRAFGSMTDVGDRMPTTEAPTHPPPVNTSNGKADEAPKTRNPKISETCWACVQAGKPKMKAP